MRHALTVPIPQSVQSLYDSNVAAGSTPKLNDLQDALVASLKLFAEIFFVFDALDECQECMRKDLLPLIHWIAGSGSKIFLTSRPYPEDIAISLNPNDHNRNVQRLDLAAKEEDVIIYIEETIQEHIKARRLITGDLRAAVVSKLVDSCKGMFLLVHFYIEDLCQYPTAREIRHALGNISSTLGTESALDGTYRRAVDSIRAQHRGRVTLALKALAWLLAARCTLSVDELRLAIAMDEEGCSQLHGDDILDTGSLHSLLNDMMPDEASILDACRGLVIVDHKSYTIKLAHYSVHEYLEGTGAIGGLANLHLTVALGCLGLGEFSSTEKKLRSRDDFGTGWRTSSARYSLLGYINDNLHKHIQASHQIAPTETLLRFLRDRDLLQHIGIKGPRSLPCYRAINDEPCPLQTATAWGSIRLVNGLLEPLQDGVNLTRQIQNGNTPLHVAVTENLVELVRFWLDDGVDPEARDGSGETALACAITASSMDAARLLLSRGADLGRAVTGSSMWRREMMRNIDMLGLLFEFGLDVEHGMGGMRMLQNAVCIGDSGLVKFLLGKGANVNALDSNQETALHFAVGWSNRGMVMLLLESGANVNARDTNHKTPLHIAVGRGRRRMVQLLLESGADANARDNSQTTLLHLV
ncbi:ankyrin repeat-containing domain protein, partial [Morchella snyderi]